MSLAVVLAVVLGGPDAREAARALETQCDSTACIVEGMTYFAHESGLSRSPIPFSHDAKDHTSCGLGQTPCAVTPADVPGQVRVWLRMRSASLAQWGDLRGLPGVTHAGIRIARARAVEASWLAQLAVAGIE